MQIEHIREFLLLARTLSFSDAAGKLYITRTALSRHITAMEDELGVKLLDRESHPLALTEEGRAFLADSEATVAAYDASLENLRIIARSRKRPLRIGYLHDAGREYLGAITKALARFDESIAPQYSMYEYGDLANALRERKVDVAVSIDLGRRCGSSERCVCLGEDAHYAALPLGHPLAGQQSVSLDQLARENVIFPDPQAMGPMHEFFGELLQVRETGIAPGGFYKDIPSLIFQIEAGEGVSLLLGHHSQRYGDEVAFVPVAELPAATCCIAIIWDATAEERVPGRWPEALHSLG